MPNFNFWKQLPEDASKVLKKSTLFKTFKKGATIYSFGDTPQGIYVVKSGLVGLVTTSNKGSEHLLRLFVENMFFGHRSLFANETYYASAICLEQSEIGLVPKEVVEEILENFPGTARLLIETLARELGLAELQRLKIADQEVLQRLASSLIYLKEIHPDHRWTRNEIAHFCGSTGPTVIRGLAELEERGLIHQEGRDIRILDRASLLELAQE